MEEFSLTETAKMIRVALKEAFPKTKFSVRSKSYSMGCSIDVSWTDGPSDQRVDAILKTFEGAEFDGGDDSKKYKNQTVKAPDGTTKEVRYNVDYVMGSRSISNWDEREFEAQEFIKANCNIVDGRFKNESLDMHARRLVRMRDENETIESAFKRIVLRGTS